jgi:competence protein ComEC
MRLALAFAAGAGWVHAGAPLVLAPLAAVLWLLAPTRASSHPGRVSSVLVAALGFGAAWVGRPGAHCVPGPEGEAATLEGRFVASPRTGSGAFLRAAGCGLVTVVVGDDDDDDDDTVRAGYPVALSGRWRAGPGGRGWFLARAVTARPTEGALVELRWAPTRWRDGLVDRFERLYGEHAPLVSALVLARAEGLDPDLREAYARSGIAHMLAISGYHVGVIAALVLGLLRARGWAMGKAALGAAGLSTVYVGFIGFPDAALRAAIMVTLVALARARTHPPAKWGALGAALLILVAWDPRRVASAGVQLSFAGVAGLVAWCGPLCRALQSWCQRWTGRRCPQEVAMAIASGVAATIATLPIVSWHFERISLVGIPATIAATPLIAWALVGSIVSLALDFVSPTLAAFVAGGVDVTLVALDVGATHAAAWPWASVWTTRASVVAGVVGLAVALAIARHPRVHARARRGLTALYIVAAVLVWPVLVAWQGRGTTELMMIDVGQGDAIAVRTPEGRWLLVDAGPPAREDPGAHPVVRALAARGVRRLDAVVLTHPHLDHIGGADAVLRSFDVGAVYDPGLPAPSAEYLALLELAAERGIPWLAARAGDRFDLGGLHLEVMHPVPGATVAADANETSVVIQLSHGDFDALLTGDAYRDAERRLTEGRTVDLEVLKVGHHGSDTSTDSLLLARLRPDVALISAGRSNRYGHPSLDVLSLLDGQGVRVWRTDERGTITVLGRPDGTYTVGSTRRPDG